MCYKYIYPEYIFDGKTDIETKQKTTANKICKDPTKTNRIHCKNRNRKYDSNERGKIKERKRQG